MDSDSGHSLSGGYQSRMNAVLRAYVYARRERTGLKP